MDTTCGDGLHIRCSQGLDPHDMRPAADCPDRIRRNDYGECAPAFFRRWIIAISCEITGIFRALSTQFKDMRIHLYSNLLWFRHRRGTTSAAQSGCLRSLRRTVWRMGRRGRMPGASGCLSAQLERYTGTIVNFRNNKIGTNVPIFNAAPGKA